jgi:hypothetical protein
VNYKLNFQSELIEFMKKKDISFHDNTKSTSGSDFSIVKKNTFKDVSDTPEFFNLELKEKTLYRKSNWPTRIPIKHLFICDDLTLRKLLCYAPDSGLAIRDNTTGNFHIFFIIDLFYISKNRVNRPIKRQVSASKGKCLLDLRNSIKCESIHHIFRSIGDYLRNKEDIFNKQTECYGTYHGEEIGSGGIVREEQHWKNDLEKYS